MEKRHHFYSGKAKSIYATDNPDVWVLEFRDDATAFNGIKKASLAHKGAINNYFNTFFMQQLATAGISTHLIKQLSDTESLVHRLEMLPVECVVRNITAGNLCKRLGVTSGITLSEPIFEFFLKNDKLNDPIINEDHIRAFGWASNEEVALLKQRTLQINQILQAIFAPANLLLVDFKLEFGRLKGDLVLGDEFTPDGCRIWDATTRESLDKDRFRQDLGNVIEGYQEVARRLGIKMPTYLS
jgi:phosphoribosylaminoimidazole-succinocarboxamide synthase